MAIRIKEKRERKKIPKKEEKNLIKYLNDYKFSLKFIINILEDRI